MPVIAALIGYSTKRAAIEMMYRPLEFVGVRPFLGWQGVIPRNAHRTASVAMELMTTNLIEPKEIFARSWLSTRQPRGRCCRSGRSAW